MQKNQTEELSGGDLPAMISTESRPLFNAAPRDLAVLVLLVLIFFGVAAHIELSERLARWTAGYEHWQVDEVPLTLLVLSLGLTLFSWRRWHELRRALVARQRAEQQSLLMLEQNRQLAQQLIQLQEQERATLARELHDELGQSCVAIRVDAATIAGETHDQLPTAHQSACAIIETVGHLHEVVRDMLHRLRPSGLDELGLIASVRMLIDAWSRRNGVPCILVAEEVNAGLSEAVNMAIFRTVQESLTNIAQHARANQVTITMRRLGSPDPVSGPPAAPLELTIHDDGQGMPARTRPLGLGILGMRERISSIGGQFSVASESAGGTTVRALIPYRGPAELAL